jgi:DNA-binding NarL/FixJ family response regulator
VETSRLKGPPASHALVFSRSGPRYLTRRERQIASLVEEGLSNKEIACALSISPAMVKNHVQIILDKLNLSKRRMTMLAAGPGRRPSRARTSRQFG